VLFADFAILISVAAIEPHILWHNDFLGSMGAGIRQMAPDPSGSFLQSDVFDKAGAVAGSCAEAEDGEQPQPLFRRGIWTNCFPSGRTSPVVWLELLTRETLRP
jgi:hypothetical protein